MSLALPAIAPAYIHSSVKRRKNTWYSQKDGNWTDANTWTSNAMSYNTNNFNYPGQAVPVPVFPAVGDDVYINHSVTVNVAALVINNLYISGSLLFDAVARVITVNGDIQATGAVNMTGAAHNLILKGVNNYIVSFTSGATATVTYARDGDQDIMNLSYRNLAIQGLFYKYFTSNLTLSGNFLLATGPSPGNTSNGVELLTYDFTVNGTTQIQTGTFSKTGAGSILMIGALISNNNGTPIYRLTGNPSVELRGGITFSSLVNFLETGTGTWKFVGDQTLTLAGNRIFNADVLIDGTSIVTIAAGGIMTINKTLNGNNVASTIINRGGIYFSVITTPMSTGVFDYLSFSSSVGYVMNSNYTIPYTTYNGLVIDGTGVKTLSGNTTLNEGLTINPLSTTNGLECSTYDLFITGVTNYAGGFFSKNGAGTITFVGQLYMQFIASRRLDFSGGNPSIEFRGGILYNAAGNITHNLGTGAITFSTNNQSITGSATTWVFNGNVIISGAIVLTIASSVKFTGVLDGNNAASKLDNRITTTPALEYQNATQPMVTGLLETNAAANNFKYNKAGNQDVKGGTYRTIEFGGSGVKKLLGNVIVDVTSGGGQSTTGTATIDLNGFTITTI